MAKAKNGDTAKVHCTGRLEDGKVIHTTEDSEPVEFKIGEGEVILGLEKSILGMEIGDKKTITIQPEDGYGPWRKELILNVNKGDFPEDMALEVGKELRIRMRDGQQEGDELIVVISDIDEETVILDANNPLAGKTLVFDIELVGIM